MSGWITCCTILVFHCALDYVTAYKTLAGSNHLNVIANIPKNSSFLDSCVWFNCNNGKCLSPTVICDGKDDCGDGSDEKDENGECPPCHPLFWTCGNGRCILEPYICDGDNDCGDASDEQQDCPPCREDLYQCGNHVCVSTSRTCDGKDDCGDLSDETEEACPCFDNEYRCPTTPGTIPVGKCIPQDWVCDEDGIWDCLDGADEENCTSTVV